MSVRFWFFLGALVAVLVTHPALTVALLGVVGTIAVAASSQPIVWAFVAGLIVRPRITERVQRWTR